MKFIVKQIPIVPLITSEIRFFMCMVWMDKEHVLADTVEQKREKIMVLD